MQPFYRLVTAQSAAVLLTVLIAACSSDDGNNNNSEPEATGGVTSGGTGGASATGGTSGTGGTVVVGGTSGTTTGGSAAGTGGDTHGTGGAVVAGGAGGTGGTTTGGTGGSAAGTGGDTGTGGSAAGTGGDTGTGGDAGTGGSPTAAQCPATTEGETVTSIEGTWDFTPEGAAGTTIEVPGGGWIAQGHPRSLTTARYAREITVPDLGSPQATYIEFGAINHEATLNVDGTTVATNITSFTPSVFDVTAVVAPGESHTISVDVKGREALKAPGGKKLVPDAAGWSPNVPQGIFRSAVVRAVPALHISDAFVRTDVEADELSLDVWVTNDSDAEMTGTLTVALTSSTCEATQYPALPEAPVTVAAGETRMVTVGPVTWGLGPESYWWPNVPYEAGYRAKLHVAAVTLAPDTTSGVAAHTVPYRFGFRQSRQVGAHYELNGVRVNYRGDNIQGANYDSIVSDAYDLLPGFLAPSADNPGWPQAVDNYLRLNFNVNRIHQEPAAPYMLDVADEMGLMIIDETAIRGSNNDQDFSAGVDNMTAHLAALIRRDRNHPSVIRWSQCNEPEGNDTNSTAFQQALYDAAMAVDDTRPISADSSIGANPNGYPQADNFTSLEHYTNGFGVFTDRVAITTTRPFGVGEFIWPADNSRRGLAWFGTSTMALRQKEASDIRPYTLLSGWSSFVPGVTHTMLTIEQGGNPLFGEDNLPDPWSSPIIQRIQLAFNPVAVVDVAYWEANKDSNSNGDWPTNLEVVSRGATLTRDLVVFNDTFSGTTVEVAWEMHEETASGTIVDQGTTEVEVPLGTFVPTSVSVRAPENGSQAVLVLQSSKDGEVIFRDEGETFQLN